MIAIDWLAVGRRYPARTVALACLLIASRPTRAQQPDGNASERAIQPPAVTLEQLIDSVRARHPLVEAGRARVRAARGSRTTAGAFANPMVAYQVENLPLRGQAPPMMEREAMTTVTLPLDPLYQRTPRVRRADATIRAAEADASATTLQVMLAAAHMYYQTALAQVSVDAARDIAAWMDTVVAYNRVRVREGVAAEADLLRSLLERDRVASEATMQEAELVRSQALLGAFLGEADSAGRLDVPVVHVSVQDSPLRMPSVVPNRGLALGSASQPRVQAARERTMAAAAGVSAERSMLVRQLGATVGTKATGGTTSLIAGVSLPFPLFDQNRGEVARATADRDAANFELAATERDARAELAGALAAARLLTDRATTLTARNTGGRPAYLARADEARRIALGAYREGAVPLLSVIDASRAWGEARVAYYRALYAQHQSVILLLAAQGADIAAALPGLTGGPTR